MYDKSRCTRAQLLIMWIIYYVENLAKAGANIKKIRAKKRLSQSDVYRKIAMDRSYFSAIENGRKNITIGVLEKLSEALGVPASELLR